ncbi:MAG: hypothetical protein KTR31_09525 [Myxococcales bacterium]|nr:hypothetical protein [Myxococcales bacterium]
MVLWAMILDAASAADSCDPDAHVQDALAAVISGDHDRGAAALEEARKAFSCGDVADRQGLARFWLVDGAVSLAGGDAISAKDALGAARTLAPDVWLPDLSDDVRTAWSASDPSEGRGALVFEPALGVREVWVDGAQVVGLAEVTAGAHLVQVGTGTGGVAFADLVFVSPSLSVRVNTGLQPVSAPPAQVAEPSRDRRDPPPLVTSEDDGFDVIVQLVTGAGVSFGDALTAGELEEPAVKVTVPLELAAGVRAGSLMARVHAGSAWLTQGDYLAESGAGGIVNSAFRADVGASLAFTSGSLHGGVLGGVQWPGRIATRALVGLVPAGPAFLELRGGVNVATERSVEPAVELFVGVELR